MEKHQAPADVAENRCEASDLKCACVQHIQLINTNIYTNTCELANASINTKLMNSKSTINFCGKL